MSLFSSIKNIYLQNDNNFSFLISGKNAECQFERLELLESINELVPNGSLIVRDTNDIISFIDKNLVNKVTLEFFNGTYAYLYITSTTHITNAASDTEENFIAINVSNGFYKYMQSSALLDETPYYSPQVFKISDFVQFVAGLLNVTAIVDETSNYMVFKPLNTFDDRTEFASTNVLQYLNYLSGYATSINDIRPRYMFWTNWSNEMVMKHFSYQPEFDNNGASNVLTAKSLRFAIYDSDVPALKLARNNNNLFRKIYYMNSDPADQYISKNYFYIRKTPKILDKIPAGLSGDELDAYKTSSLMYQYQDEGQKYNIELISSNGTNDMVPGADQLNYDGHWGYYNSNILPNDSNLMTLLGKDFGSYSQYNELLYNGLSGYFQYVDNDEMWKMMFDFTEIHPNYPDTDSLSDNTVDGVNTNLQNILNIRYDSFKQNLEDSKSRLETFRKIEKENFVTYVLCCLAKQENCFFAKLTKYEVDKTYGSGLCGASDINVIGGVSGATYAPYRYNWVKLNFNSQYGDTGPSGTVGSGGTAYFFHNVESWEEDPFIKGNTSQDDTWAINLNERSIGNKYLPPGWITDLPTGFKWRPIGAPTNAQTLAGNSSGNIRHIVRMCAVPVTDLLLDSNQLVQSNYIGKYVYYFTAENIVDGNC